MKKPVFILLAALSILLQTACEKSDMFLLGPNRPKGYVPPKAVGHMIQPDSGRTADYDTLRISRVTKEVFDGRYKPIPHD